MVGLGVARCGGAGKARLGLAGHGQAGQGQARQARVRNQQAIVSDVLKTKEWEYEPIGVQRRL